MITPPREYFELITHSNWNNVTPPEPGAQRIGFEWYRFTGENALARMIADGCIADAPPPVNARISELEGKVEELKSRITRAINELE